MARKGFTFDPEDEEYFGDVPRSMYTLFQVPILQRAGGSWHKFFWAADKVQGCSPGAKQVLRVRVLSRC